MQCSMLTRIRAIVVLNCLSCSVRGWLGVFLMGVMAVVAM